MTTFKQNELNFTDEDELAISLNKYCKEKNVNAQVFLVTDSDNNKSFVIYNKHGNPVFVSKSFEDIAVHIDIMNLGGK